MEGYSSMISDHGYGIIFEPVLEKIPPSLSIETKHTPHRYKEGFTSYLALRIHKGNGYGSGKGISI